MRPLLGSQYHKLGLAMMIVLVLSLAILIEGGSAASEHQTIPTAPPPTATDTSESATEVPANPTQQTVVALPSTRVQPSQTQGETVIATVGLVTASPSSQPGATMEPGGGTISLLTETPRVALATGSTPGATTQATLTGEGGTSGLMTSEAGCVIGVGGGLLILMIGLIWLRRHRKS